MEVYANDDPKAAAKKLSEEGKWFVVPENGKSKEKAQKKKPKPEQIKRLVLAEINELSEELKEELGV